MRPDLRSGTVIILVAGLAAMLLSVAVAVLVRARTMGGPSVRVMAEAQNRISLSSALVYLQETSRMGWGNGPGENAYGWTDVRDGEAGPRGPADASGNISRLSWSPGGNYPAPGGAMRGDLFAWELPPYAVQQQVAPNPLRLVDADALMDGATGWKQAISMAQGTLATYPGDQNDLIAPPYWSRAATRVKNEGVNGYVTQPVLNTWAEFAAGDRRIRGNSLGRGWFRIYRELPSDRDGGGTPWYDRVPIAGHGTFIVTVGSGGTRGFRFWNSTTDYLNGRTSLPAASSGYAAVLEPVTAEASGLFVDSQVFRIMRSEELIAWYRVHWVASSSSGLDTLTMAGQVRYLLAQNRLSGVITKVDPVTDHNTTSHFGGAIRFIQRLEQEPPKW